MASSKGLTDIVGYEFYQITFTSAICFSVYVFFGYFLVLAGACAMCYLLHLAYAYQTSSPVDPKGRGVFITGCDSGIGFAFAQHLDELGFTVFASCLDDKSHGARKLRTTCSKKLHVLHCDVTKDDSINNAAEYVKKAMPKKGLWAVINNAGINMISEIELTTPSMYNRGLDVNLYGPIRVIKAFLPFIRKSQGRVVNVTSVHGLMSIPRWNNYEVAKHGMETLSDSLRLEMAKFGVRVSIVEPGAFAHATAIHTDAMVARLKKDIGELWENTPPEVRKSYDLESVLGWVPEACHSGWFTDTEALSELSAAAQHAICARYPRARYTVAGDRNTLRLYDAYTMMARVHKYLPTWIMDRIVAYFRKGQM
ncbi:retinol dehydrogenase 16-like [Mya arenaria]|uniref:retinol dehydrogenase 16-like n=1 Tax=Mya arenaria TaxID=6604 RepID=UPI0022E696D4|nr:retinol dehydrogenase 16-like [Mya arenaria]